MLQVRDASEAPALGDRDAPERLILLVIVKVVEIRIGKHEEAPLPALVAVQAAALVQPTLQMNIQLTHAHKNAA